MKNTLLYLVIFLSICKYSLNNEEYLSAVLIKREMNLDYFNNTALLKAFPNFYKCSVKESISTLEED